MMGGYDLMRSYVDHAPRDDQPLVPGYCWFCKHMDDRMCKRHAPVGVNERGEARWPLVGFYDGCGDFDRTLATMDRDNVRMALEDDYDRQMGHSPDSQAGKAQFVELCMSDLSNRVQCGVQP